jgi:hypothetical protein
MTTTPALEREALIWVAQQLRWERTLAQLRAEDGETVTDGVADERKAA